MDQVGRRVGLMKLYGPSFGIGFVTGMRSMTGSAALSWASSLGRSRLGWIPGGSRPRGLATAAALAEMAGDKMWFAPDRRIAPSFLARLAIGGLGGVSLARRHVPWSTAALAGGAGAIAGTLLGRAARGANTRSRRDWARAMTEDSLAAALATVLVLRAERRVE